ncbi:2-amino-4-hydroxy-6-hydroxymethyldihydropteridine diphosphokinase [Alteromonadaceae bacterium M269]|nr:2-amino-4-hydroxy-6-hydroxymethyldihydropteridine diphosphokinase [Alteromonadaceae bacterium M269]
MSSHTIYISVGSNIDRQANISAGLDALKKEYDDLSFSKIYESESVGFDGDNFYNLVVATKTSQDIATVVARLKQIEDEQGRDRSGAKFSSRTLDLDLLLYDDQVCDKPVQLPRDEINFNAFVLLPLKEVAPDHVHPVNQQTYSDMWDAFDKTKQTLWPIEFDWNGITL